MGSVWYVRCPYCTHEADIEKVVTSTDFWLELECPQCHRRDETSERK